MKKGFLTAFPVPFVLVDFEAVTHVVRKENGWFTQQGNDSVSKSKESWL